VNFQGFLDCHGFCCSQLTDQLDQSTFCPESGSGRLLAITPALQYSNTRRLIKIKSILVC
jgi:hypothetical protein